MSVRLRIALTIFLTGLVTALGVIATVAFAFQRFEHESAHDRGNAFLARVVANHDQLLELHDRHPDDITTLLRNLVLFENDTQLYLLDAEGRVLASTGEVELPPGFKVSIGPVRQAAFGSAAGQRMPYVMGDDPERMDANAVIAARPLRRTVIRNDRPVDGYLYLVCHKPPLPPGRLELFRSSFAMPAMALAAGVVALMTLLAAWIIGAVTRPLQRLSAEVAAVTRDGLGVDLAEPTPDGVGAIGKALPFETVSGSRAPDEFDRLRAGFRAMLDTLQLQWQALRRLDHFRREGVSNLSHDLRSPLTATAACLETLEQRWGADAARGEDRRLVEVALRNTRNAARMVASLGDLAQLDEPAFKLRAEPLDTHELLDGVAMRFAERAARAGVELVVPLSDAGPGSSSATRPETAMPVAVVDVELFERAIANLIDNALKFTPPGGRIVLSAAVVPASAAPVPEPEALSGPWVRVGVADSGCGIPATDVPHLFDRHYQSRQSVSPATAEGSKGLGLAIVKRIAELHRGQVEVRTAPGQGTEVRLYFPAQSAPGR